MLPLTIEQIAQVAHEASRAYCATLGDFSHDAWADAPAWQRNSVIAGVANVRAGKVTKPEDSHREWMAHKQREGWVYGDVKDAEAKTHPCMVPYHQLPPEQRRKDALFFAIVTALSRADA